MSQREYRQIKRRKTRQIMVGNVAVGGDAPISVQSMTNTLTTDVKATIEQIRRIREAGADIVRISCPDQESALALKKIVPEAGIPVVADIHFHYQRAIEAAQSGAAALRINPGNIGNMDRVRDVIKAAKDYGCSMRIGVNAGSLDKHILEKYGEPCPQALVESAMQHAKILEDNDFLNFKISVKASDVFLCLAAYRELSKVCDYPLHLGVTEAGGLRTGTIKNSIGIGMLLAEGIGDTLRVSLSADQTEEVKAGFEILKALDLRHRGVRIVSCPSCARQGFDVVKMVEALDKRLEHILAPVSLSILGCVVNGPGEAKETNIGLTGGGAGQHMVYIEGMPDHKTSEEEMIEHIVKLVEEKAKSL